MKAIKKLIVVAILGLFILAVVLLVFSRGLILEERESTIYRKAHCQFSAIASDLVSSNVFWSTPSGDDSIWFQNIDLTKVKERCSESLVVVEGQIFDFTGAQIVLDLSQGRRKYLRRVKGENKYFVSLRTNEIEIIRREGN